MATFTLTGGRDKQAIAIDVADGKLSGGLITDAGGDQVYLTDAALAELAAVLDFYKEA